VNSAILFAVQIAHTAEVEFTLSIDITQKPPCGEIVADGKRPLSFVGWLGLLGCLSELVESAGGEP
jgi:hypothetical protein